MTIPVHGTVARSQFEEGELAFDAGEEKDDCPYAHDSAAGIQWCTSWEAAEWQAQLEREGQLEDWRLDDPHRRAV